MPDQQPQFLDQAIQVHGRQLRLRRAGQVEDLLDDAVQLLEFLVNDPRVLRPRVALGKLQIQRMVEHLEHSQRIANLMSGLGGQQPQVHDALVKPRLLDGDGGQLRQRRKNVGLFVRETVGLAGIDAQGADRLAAIEQRHAKQRHQPLGPRHFRALITAGHLHVLDLQRLLPPHHDTEQAILQAQARPVDVGLARAEAGPQFEPLAAFVQQHQRAHLGLHQHAGFAGDNAQGVIQVQRGIDRPADAGQ